MSVYIIHDPYSFSVYPGQKANFSDAVCPIGPALPTVSRLFFHTIYKRFTVLLYISPKLFIFTIKLLKKFIKREFRKINEILVSHKYTGLKPLSGPPCILIAGIAKSFSAIVIFRELSKRVL